VYPSFNTAIYAIDYPGFRERNQENRFHSGARMPSGSVALFDGFGS
jgi:hypothetical protein